MGAFQVIRRFTTTSENDMARRIVTCKFLYYQIHETPTNISIYLNETLYTRKTSAQVCGRGEAKFFFSCIFRSGNWQAGENVGAS
jgi:hypothetical protein